MVVVRIQLCNTFALMLVVLPMYLLTLCRTILNELARRTVHQTTAFGYSSGEGTLVIPAFAHLLHAFVLLPLLVQTGA